MDSRAMVRADMELCIRPCYIPYSSPYIESMSCGPTTNTHMARTDLEDSSKASAEKAAPCGPLTHGHGSHH